MVATSGVLLLGGLIYLGLLCIVSFFLSCPFPLALWAHIVAPAFTSRLVGTGAEQPNADYRGKRQVNVLSVGIHHEDEALLDFMRLRVFSEESIG